MSTSVEYLLKFWLLSRRHVGWPTDSTANAPNEKDFKTVGSRGEKIVCKYGDFITNVASCYELFNH